MSNMYVTEPATEGKVLLHTSFGDLDIELWPQQAPKACRNFVQLCLEGYYDNTIFHRIIKDFMVQGGDPTGTGTGGESVYGEPFIDEFHSRLKFNHRGIVAMANENKPNSNHAQFFFTLDACEFLNRKHTIFGKITGNTIFNLLSVSDVDTDDSDRPLSPPKLLSAEVLWNPFDDIVVRETTRRAPEESETAKKKRQRKATKDRKLLSFGDEEEVFDQEDGGSKKKKKKKVMSSHDLLDDTKLKAEVDQEIAQKIAETTKDSEGADASSGGKEKSVKMDARARLKAAVAAASAGTGNAEEKNERSDDAPVEAKQDELSEKKKKLKTAVKDERDEYTRLREELKRDKKAAAVLLGQKARVQELAKAKSDVLTPLQQQRAKFLERKKMANRSGRQQDTLQKLAQFQATLLGVNEQHASRKSDETTEAYHGQVLEDDDDNDDETAKDKSWMAAKLKFKKHIDDQFRNNYGPTVDDYMTVDTRTERDGRSKPDADRPRDGQRRNRSRERSADRSRDRRRDRFRSRERRR